MYVFYKAKWGILVVLIRWSTKIIGAVGIWNEILLEWFTPFLFRVRTCTGKALESDVHHWRGQKSRTSIRDATTRNSSIWRGCKCPIGLEEQAILR